MHLNFLISSFFFLSPPFVSPYRIDISLGLYLRYYPSCCLLWVWHMVTKTVNHFKERKLLPIFAIKWKDESSLAAGSITLTICMQSTWWKIKFFISGHLMGLQSWCRVHDSRNGLWAQIYDWYLRNRLAFIMLMVIVPKVFLFLGTDKSCTMQSAPVLTENEKWNCFFPVFKCKDIPALIKIMLYDDSF